MEVVIGILHLNSPNGAATYALTVAHHLQRLGHGVTLFTRDAGLLAEAARARGLRVVTEPDALPASCDALLTNDAAIACELADRRPVAAHVFVAHSAEGDMGLPPQVPGAISAVVVMNDRVARRAAAMALDVEVVRLRQPIDVERFAARSPARARPRRALLLGNYLRGPKRDMVTAACERAGLEWTQVGRDTQPVFEPASAIADADIVIGYGRAVLEAMSCGRAAYICDQYAGDGWVTPARYDALESDGFRGTAFEEVLDEERVARDLGEYAPGMGIANRDIVLSRHNAFGHANELAALFGRLAPRPADQPAPLAEMVRLVRLQWHSDWTVQEYTREIQDLRDQIEELHQRLWAAEDASARAIIAFNETRRYRVAQRIGRPLDVSRRLFSPNGGRGRNGPG